VRTLASLRAFVAGGCLMAGAALLLLWRYPLLDHADGLTDLGKIAGYTREAFALYVGCVLALFAGYAVAATALHRTRESGRTWAAFVAFSAILLLVFAFIYPATAVDIYLYAVRSRIWTEFGEDPSRVIPYYILGDDPYRAYLTNQWASTLSPYGPLWNWIAAPGSMLSNREILPALLYYKSVSIVAAIGVAWILQSMTRNVNPALAAAAALLWLWNPLVLWEGVAGGHNDIVAILPLTAALWCWQRERTWLVFPLLTVSVLIKYTALPILPVAAIAIFRRASLRGEVWQVGFPSVAMTAGISMLSLAPFFDPRALWDALLGQRGVFVTSIPGAMLRASSRYGWGIEKDRIGDVAAAIVAVAVLAACLHVWKDPERFFLATYSVMLVLLLFGTTNLRPWYIVWLLPLAIATGVRGPWRPAIIGTATALLSYAHYIWIRDWWHVSGLRLEVTGLAFTLGPVILAVAWEWWTRRKSPQEFA
jgi:hypothetical protein